MYVYRLHIRPSGGAADLQTTFQYCLKHGLLGVGWRTNSQRNTKDWDEYFTEASQIHDRLQVCKYIHQWVKPDDLIWTRDPKGQYYLARVTSGWEYWCSSEAIECDIDIANIVRCDIRPVKVDWVPGKVVACFRATRTIQEVADEKARAFSMHLWNHLADEMHYALDSKDFQDLFMLLDDEETEDVVFLYLQREGWFVVPNSRKGDTMAYEFLLVHPESHRQAVTQVKTGNVVLRPSDYSEETKKEGKEVFLFQANDLYEGEPVPHITCIPREKIQAFIDREIAWLPGWLKIKMEMASSGKLA